LWSEATRSLGGKRGEKGFEQEGKEGRYRKNPNVQEEGNQKY